MNSAIDRSGDKSHDGIRERDGHVRGEADTRHPVPVNEERPDLIVGRDDAAADPQTDSPGEGHGHPLPASEKARHGSIPERLERERGHGAN